MIRFGEFSADVETGELLRNGVKVRLQGQPFEILVLLLQRPGRIVTREELHKKLWPADTFVDFEHGLNAAVNKLRVSLGDSAENPVWIDTLPRRGYRFIGEVVAPALPVILIEPRSRQVHSYNMAEVRGRYPGHFRLYCGSGGFVSMVPARASARAGTITGAFAVYGASRSGNLPSILP